MNSSSYMSVDSRPADSACCLCGKDAPGEDPGPMFGAFLAFVWLAVAIRLEENRAAQHASEVAFRREPPCGPGQVLVPCQRRGDGDHNSDCRCGGTEQIAVCEVCKGDDWLDEETPCACKGAAR